MGTTERIRRKGGQRPRRSRVRPALGALLVVAGVALVAAGSATAATYCVHQPADPCEAGEIDQGASLQSALTGALQQPDADLIKIGPGTFTGPFVYSGSGAIEVAGSGPSTVLTAPAANGVIVLDLALGPGARSLHGFTVAVPGGNTTQNNIGIWARADFDSVAVTMPPAPTGATFGVTLFSPASFSHGSVTGPPVTAGPPVGGIGTAPFQPGGVTVSDTKVVADEAISAGADTIIHRVDAYGFQGFKFQSDGPVGTNSIDNSLWRSPPGVDHGVGLAAGCGNGASLNVVARHLTLVNTGTDPNSNTVVSTCNLPGKSSAIDLHDSIVRGGVASLRVNANNGPATIDVSYSDFDPAAVIEFGPEGAAITSGAGNVNVDPGFAAADDFRLRADSALIDAGDPAELAPGESTIDLAGAARVFDARGAGPRRDIGAFEWSPPPPPSATPGFAFGKLKRNRRRGTATLAIEVEAAGVVELTRTGKLRGASANAAGPGTVNLKLRPRGRARRKLVESDSRASVRVRAEVSFAPAEGPLSTAAKRVKLVRKPR